MVVFLQVFLRRLRILLILPILMATLVAVGNAATAEKTVMLFDEAAQPMEALSSVMARKFAKDQGRLVILSDVFREEVKSNAGSSFTLFVNLQAGAITNVKMTAGFAPHETDGYRRLVARDDADGFAGLRGVLSERGLTAVVEVASRTFRIEPVSDLVHVIYEIDSQKFLPEAPPLVPPAEKRGEKGAKAKLCDEAFPFPVPPGKGHRIRFLALYTPAAAARVADIRAEITLAFDLTRAAFTNPNFLVHADLAAIELVNFVETDSGTDLTRLTNGSIAGVHDRRNANAADLVAVFTNHTDVCGRAWLNEQPSPAQSTYAYSISNIGCAVSNKTTPHEIGHNIGMQHDRANASPSSLGYNYGHIIFSQRLRSLMAYDTECTKQGFSCTRVNSFSSPNVLFKTDPLGAPIGTAGAAHNLEVLCDNSAAISKWR